MNIRTLIWILWPSFLIAGVAEIVLFSFMAPEDMVLLGGGVEVSNEAVYSVGFLLLWVMCALSSALTWFVLPREGEDSLN
jgi:membrane protein DedA with SNARE-associated domain